MKELSKLEQMMLARLTNNQELTEEALDEAVIMYRDSKNMVRDLPPFDIAYSHFLNQYLAIKRGITLLVRHLHHGDKTKFCIELRTDHGYKGPTDQFLKDLCEITNAELVIFDGLVRDDKRSRIITINMLTDVDTLVEYLTVDRFEYRWMPAGIVERFVR